jgi:drug/metabolite transporter (DMT)-like permease
MKNTNTKWIYLIILSVIWGSSFILIKLALKSLTPIQVGAMRIIISSIILLIVGYSSIKGLTKRQWFYILITALAGTFFPAFMFAVAIDNMDSSITAILNSLTPFNTLIFGALFFGFSFKPRQLFGVLIGLIGTVMLVYYSKTISLDEGYFYLLLILASTIGYAINVNVIKKYLSDVKPLSITAGNFVLIVIPALIILYMTDFFTEIEFTDDVNRSLGYVLILSLFGTALAKTLFNKLVLISTPIFSSSVTYLIPIVAVFWGTYFGEKLSLMQLLSSCVILLGVYLVNKSK